MGRAYALSLVIIASGCVQPQPTPTTNSAPGPTPLQLAERHLAEGQFEIALAEYANLSATATEPEATRLRIKAELIKQDLRQENATPNPAAPLADPALEALRQLATAAATLDSGDSATVLAQLEATAPGSYDRYERGFYLRALGRAQLAQGSAVPAASNLLAAEAYPMPINRRGELTHAIWEAFEQGGAEKIEAALPPDAPYGAGWVSLSKAVAANAFSPPDLATAIASWQLGNPQHPAQVLLIDELLERAEEAASAPTKIALLLPLKGTLGGIGSAIRDGFIAMRFSAGMNASSPEIVVYDVTAADIASVSKAALAAGANFIVGPLDKAALDTLLAAGTPPVPMLALNTATKPPPSATRLFQFGLRPEDEAIDAADRAWQDGRRRMIAMGPATELGDRLLAAFVARWQELGGTVVDRVRFNHSVAAYAAAVKQTFGLRQSEERAATLRRLLGRSLISEPRRRDDVDGIMLSAPPVEARQILPQFRFFGADRLPIYATSHVFSGAVNPGADQDLNGVMFGDSPWILGGGDEALKRTFFSHWGGGISNLRFFAFGADAYRIIPYLAQMRAQPSMRIAGATGQLRVDQSGLVRRNLTWARFAGGRPRLLSQYSP